MKTAIVMGTRPEIIKLSPIVNSLNKKNSIVVFTGQHFDNQMSLNFIRDLGMRKPDYTMKLTKLQNSTSDRATQISEMIGSLAKIFSSTEPDRVIVQGDTNTVLAAGITALKCNIPICHVEAGLRSYDWRMPEEHNRIAIDHISNFLFAPTKLNKTTLENEQVHGKIFVTGNTSIDAVEQNVKKINLVTMNLPFSDFVLVTIHRGENVDNRSSLISIINSLIGSKMDFVFPIHPRTLNRLKQFGLYNKIKNSKNILLLPPVGYFEILYLMKKCQFIISDSGGIQEEATSPHIRKKVLVIRKSSDRIEAVKEGYSELVGTDTGDIIKAIKKNHDLIRLPHTNPYGSGNAAKKIINILRKNTNF